MEGISKSLVTDQEDHEGRWTGKVKRGSRGSTDKGAESLAL